MPLQRSNCPVLEEGEKIQGGTDVVLSCDEADLHGKLPGSFGSSGDAGTSAKIQSAKDGEVGLDWAEEVENEYCFVPSGCTRQNKEHVEENAVEFEDTDVSLGCAGQGGMPTVEAGGIVTDMERKSESVHCVPASQNSYHPHACSVHRNPSSCAFLRSNSVDSSLSGVCRCGTLLGSGSGVCTSVVFLGMPWVWVVWGWNTVWNVRHTGISEFRISQFGF